MLIFPEIFCRRSRRRKLVLTGKLLVKMEQDMIGAEKWIELIKEYSVPKELTAPLLNAMIEKILIHEATTNEDNERIQEIEIYYRFIGKVE